MKFKYLAALAAVSVFGVATLTSCGPKEEAAPDAATEEAAPDAMAEPEPAASPSPAPATP
jgi:hypothetical protein